MTGVQTPEGVNMRKTKIICTIGPASQSEEKLRELMLAGMNVARFNFSHGDHEEQHGKYDRMRKVSKELNLPIAALLDTKGPEIRLRDFEGGKVMLEAGQKFTLTTKEIMGTNEIASITYKELIHDISAGTTILIDDGLIEMTVEEITDTDIICNVVNGGPVSNHKGVNVPGAELSMPYISESDKNDILFGVELGFDIIAASFVRNKEDVLEVRKILDERNSKMMIISKIENMQGIKNLDEIIEVSVLQKQIIKKAVAKGKQVITATQMLESMMHNPRPTRAETTDIANAIYDGTTAIMLSGESAQGQYPVEAVQTMARIAERTEEDIDFAGRLKKREVPGDGNITTAISHATCTLAADLDVKAIICVTMSGFTASMISRFKPSCPIIGCTVKRLVWRQLNLQWGVMPLLIQEENTAEDLFHAAIDAAVDAGYIVKGDKIIITAGMPLGISGKTNQLRVVEV